MTTQQTGTDGQSIAAQAADYVATRSGTPLRAAIETLSQIGEMPTRDAHTDYWYTIAALLADELATRSGEQTPEISAGDWCDHILRHDSVIGALVSTLAAIGALRPMTDAQIWWYDVAAILADRCERYRSDTRRITQ